jgi:hypothetical protein
MNDERSPLGIKAVSEIGITSSAGVVANAVWHATGIRVREFPITLERLIAPGSAGSSPNVGACRISRSLSIRLLTNASQ